jgi:hypothetical protein
VVRTWLSSSDTRAFSSSSFFERPGEFAIQRVWWPYCIDLRAELACL